MDPASQLRPSDMLCFHLRTEAFLNWRLRSNSLSDSLGSSYAVSESVVAMATLRGTRCSKPPVPALGLVPLPHRRVVNISSMPGRHLSPSPISNSSHAVPELAAFSGHGALSFHVAASTSTSVDLSLPTTGVSPSSILDSGLAGESTSMSSPLRFLLKTEFTLSFN